MDTTLRERFGADGQWVSFEALAAGGRGSRPPRSPQAAGRRRARASGRALIAQAPFKLGVSGCLSPFCLRARLGKWLSTSSTLGPSAWPGGLSGGTNQERPPVRASAPCGQLGLVFDLSSAPPQRGLPGPRGASVRALLRRGHPQGTGDPSSPEITLLAPKVPLSPRGRGARHLCLGPRCSRDPGHMELQAPFAMKREKQDSWRMEPTRGGGAEPWTVSRVGAHAGPPPARGL
ncbi:uncharacterized protein LOC122437793 [Cervus canadensis]|uniref:uncharacterized protein LOC122437793 n=1 Tax=Cervus canadensis TaxID=1574408 RepID=UPI001C9E6A8D|nr:uncharacterized protein LOC122437793 [Cervus canadensis]